MALVPALDLTTLFGFQVALWAQNNPNQPQRANGPQCMGPIGATWAPMGPYVLPLSRRMVVDGGQASTDAAGCLVANSSHWSAPLKCRRTAVSVLHLWTRLRDVPVGGFCAARLRGVGQCTGANKRH